MKRIDEYRCTAYADGRYTVEHIIGYKNAPERKLLIEKLVIPMTGSGDHRTLQEGAEDEARNFVAAYKYKRKQQQAAEYVATTFTIKA